MMSRSALALLCGISASILASTHASSAQDRRETRIITRYETKSESSSGSSGSSRGSNAYLERIISSSPDALVLEYDIALEPDQTRPLYAWQYPFRVRSNAGILELLDRDLMIQRRDAWLRQAGYPKEACGRHVFTWSVFKIECDPDAVLEQAETLTLQFTGLPDNAVATHPLASETGVFTLVSGKDDGRVYTARLSLDPAAIRQRAAQTAVTVAEVSGEELDFDEALARQRFVKVDGSILIELSVEASGRVVRRRTLIEFKSVERDGEVKKSRETYTVERQQLQDTRE